VQAWDHAAGWLRGRPAANRPCDIAWELRGTGV
jgi:hypothetical protein